jgi:hypothetical protein
MQLYHGKHQLQQGKQGILLYLCSNSLAKEPADVGTWSRQNSTESLVTQAGGTIGSLRNAQSCHVECIDLHCINPLPSNDAYTAPNTTCGLESAFASLRFGMRCSHETCEPCNHERCNVHVPAGAAAVTRNSDLQTLKILNKPERTSGMHQERCMPTTSWKTQANCGSCLPSAMHRCV